MAHDELKNPCELKETNCKRLDKKYDFANVDEKDLKVMVTDFLWRQVEHFDIAPNDFISYKQYDFSGEGQNVFSIIQRKPYIKNLIEKCDSLNEQEVASITQMIEEFQKR